MNQDRQQGIFWIVGLIVTVALLWLLRGVLLPFVAAMAVAYFLDPWADRLEAVGFSRTLATATLIVGLFALALILLLLLVPLIEQQVVQLINQLPGYVDILRDRLLPAVTALLERIDVNLAEDLKNSVGAHPDQAWQVASGVLVGLWGGGLALFNVLSLVVITPVASFYLLRDWDRIVARVDSWLPRQHAPVIREQVRQIDRVIAGFARGQAVVCLFLALYYGIGFSLVGLNSGLAIGLIAGILSFVPFVGSLFGLGASIIVALVQFWPNYLMVGAVLAVSLTGQLIEGNILQPKLIGDRVGLHPVWVIFSLLAGATLFGFLGVLLAVPVFAVIGVLTRFALSRYLASDVYGTDAGARPYDEPPGF